MWNEIASKFTDLLLKNELASLNSNESIEHFLKSEILDVLKMNKQEFIINKIANPNNDLTKTFLNCQNKLIFKTYLPIFLKFFIRYYELIGFSVQINLKSKLNRIIQNRK